MPAPARPAALSAMVRQYVARTVVRQRGTLKPAFAENLRSNVRRSYRVSIDGDEARALIGHFQGLYAFAAGALPKFLATPRGRRA